MKAIYKYPLPVQEKYAIELPKDAVIIRCEDVDGLFFLWAIVDTEAELEKRFLEFYKTGQEILTPLDQLIMRGTCKLFIMQELCLYVFENIFLTQQNRALCSTDKLPKSLGLFEVESKEMMFYQYLPIKMPGENQPLYEDRLKCFDKLVGTICCDFIGVFGLDKYVSSYVYLTAKYAYQTPGCSYNRPGYHADGFMTDDINYIWSDNNPTIFNKTEFNLTMDDSGSLVEMEEQAIKENEITFPVNSLLRLDQFNIHKVADITHGCMRTFLKISFSKDKYDLIGNSHNYLIDYNWEMKQRNGERNIPQTKIS